MNRINALLLLVCLCSGCFLFRKASKQSTAYKSKNSVSTSSTEQKELKKDLSEKIVVLTKDSAGSELTTIIWPRGYFRFSPENGFTGEADRIQLTHKRSMKSEDLKQAERHVLTDATVKKSAASKSSAGVITKAGKATTSSNYWIGLLVLGGSVLAIMRYYKYLRSK